MKTVFECPILSGCSFKPHGAAGGAVVMGSVLDLNNDHCVAVDVVTMNQQQALYGPAPAAVRYNVPEDGLVPGPPTGPDIGDAAGIALQQREPSLSIDFAQLQQWAKAHGTEVITSKDQYRIPIDSGLNPDPHAFPMDRASDRLGVVTFLGGEWFGINYGNSQLPPTPIYNTLDSLANSLSAKIPGALGATWVIDCREHKFKLVQDP